MQSRYPLTFAYFNENKEALQARERGRMRGPNWYAYIYPKNIEVMKTPKILVPDIADRAAFALDEEGQYAFTSGYGITLLGEIQLSIKYVLGLLNSKVLDFYLKRISTTLRGGFFRYFTQFIEQLPIRSIDFSNPQEKAQHDKMVELVQAMLDQNRRLDSVRTDDERKRIERMIASTDEEINALVYELYGLSKEEIAIVEGQE